MRSAFGADARETALPLGRLAELTESSAGPEAAEPLWKRAIAVIPPNALVVDLELIALQYHLALNYQARSLHNSATSVLRELEYSAELANDPLINAAVLSAYGLSETAAGYPRNAEALLRRAMALAATLPPGEIGTRATAARNLAEALVAQDRIVEAEEVLATALIDADAHDPAVARAIRTDQAVLLRTQGDQEAAELLMRRVLADAETAFGIDNDRTASTMADLARTLEARGGHVEAESYYRRALALMEVSANAGGRTLSIRMQLGNNLLIQRRDTDAAEVLAPLEKSLDEGSVPRASEAFALTLVAQLHSVQGAEIRAEPRLLAALDLRREIDGDDAFSTAEVLKLLAICFGNQGQFENARIAAQGSSEILLRRLPAGHPDRVESDLILAAALERTDRREDSIDLLRRTERDIHARAGTSGLRGRVADGEVARSRPVFRRVVRVAWGLAELTNDGSRVVAPDQ